MRVVGTMQFWTAVSPRIRFQPIHREEVETAVESLEKGKSAGVDNISADLVQAGGENLIDFLTEFCNRIWRMVLSHGISH